MAKKIHKKKLKEYYLGKWYEGNAIIYKRMGNYDRTFSEIDGTKYFCNKQVELLNKKS